VPWRITEGMTTAQLMEILSGRPWTVKEQVGVLERIMLETMYATLIVRVMRDLEPLQSV